MNSVPSCYLITALYVLKASFSLLDTSGPLQILHKVQDITSYFRLFCYLFRSLKMLQKLCRSSYQRANTSLIVSPGQKWEEFIPSDWYSDANIELQMSKEGIYMPVKGFLLFNTFSPSYKLLKTSLNVSRLPTYYELF